MIKSSQPKSFISTTTTLIIPQNEAITKTMSSYFDKVKTRDETLAALAAIQSELTKSG